MFCRVRLQNTSRNLASNYSPEDHEVLLRLWEQCAGLVGSNDDDVDGSIDEGSAGPPAGIQLRSVCSAGWWSHQGPSLLSNQICRITIYPADRDTHRQPTHRRQSNIEIFDAWPRPERGWYHVSRYRRVHYSQVWSSDNLHKSALLLVNTLPPPRAATSV